MEKERKILWLHARTVLCRGTVEGANAFNLIYEVPFKML